MQFLLLLLVLRLMPLALSKFQCLESTNCYCSSRLTGDFEIFCPKSGQPIINMTFQPKNNIEIRCAKWSSWKELELTSGLNFGPVRVLSFESCPLPRISFKELMTTMRIHSTDKLQFDYSGNTTTVLTKYHLEGLHSLNTLIIHYNDSKQMELPKDLFNDLGNLKKLRLDINELILPKGIFRFTLNLEELVLGMSNISFLEPDIFRNLTNLRTLIISENKLQNLTRSVFSDIRNLERLYLNNNGLKTLPPDIFTDLIELKNVVLDENDFVSLPQSLFRSTLRLERIGINSNRHSLKTLPPAFFANLTNMKYLYLKKNNISELSEDLLTGCRALQFLGLGYNNLREVSEKIFNDIQDVRKIDLSHNKLVNLPNGLFSSLYKLKELYLNHNEITELQEELFSNLFELQIINLSHNKIRTIHSEAFEVKKHLLNVDLSYNELRELGNNLPFPTSSLKFARQLENLNLSHNNFGYFYSDWQISMTRLQFLDMSYNNFTKLTIHDINKFLSNYTKIDLSYNNIREVSLDEAELLAAKRLEAQLPLPLPHGKREHKSPIVILNMNPLQCDCNAFHILQYFKQLLDPEISHVARFVGVNLICAGPQVLKDTFVLDPKLDPREVACEADETECPKNCSCKYRPSNSAMIVDCSQRNLTRIPLAMPTNGTLLSRADHIELNLKRNKLITIPDQLGPGYSNVTKLYLSYNNLTSINLTSFSKDLQVVELDNNNLTRLDIGLLKTLDKLEIITLQNNPWICDCQSRELPAFLQRNFKKVHWLENITCSNGALMSKLTTYDLCPLTSEAIKAGSIVIAGMGLVMGALIGFYYRFQKEIKVWLYANQYCLWLVTEEEIDKDKKYDAFVSYSHQDEKFVIEHLQPVLEKGDPKYSLCLHYRDWLVGDLIPAQIARSVEESRRTIVVLSPHFLESVWGKMEFRTAHCQALREGRARVIMILYGDIGPTEILDPELKAYLSTNTYVKWGDAWFWPKLRYALPHPTRHSTGDRQSRRRIQNKPI